MPKALDTNIVVRFLFDDGSKEVPIAREIFRREYVEISAGVILESEWVLRAIYKVKPDAICDSFEALMSLDTVFVHDQDVIGKAVRAHRAGVEFADAFHLYFAEKSDEFLTFDTDFVAATTILSDALPLRIPTLNSLEGHR